MTTARGHVTSSTAGKFNDYRILSCYVAFGIFSRDIADRMSRSFVRCNRFENKRLGVRNTGGGVAKGKFSFIQAGAGQSGPVVYRSFLERTAQNTGIAAGALSSGHTRLPNGIASFAVVGKYQ